MDILLVEDDFDVAQNICEHFELSGHNVEWAPDGLIGLERATADARDIIILDITLPRMSGIDLCHRLRELGLTTVPIVMLTARGDLDDKVTAFGVGADDYIVKPYALEELESRIHALIRRSYGVDCASVLRVGELTFNTATHQVSRQQTKLAVSATARKILEILMRNSKRVVPKQEIEQTVWGDNPPQSDSLKIHIYALREAIDKPFNSSMIKTIRGVGYRITAGDED